MKTRISIKRKLAERGKGQQENYQPYIKAREISDIGTANNIVDWKHGRTVELLSEGEAYLYYLLRWHDDVTDIREQFPLKLEETNCIADLLQIERVNRGRDCMTTDMLVTFANGKEQAFSVKYSRKATEQNRTVEKLYIEKMYWNRKNIPWHLVYKTDLPEIKIQNIRQCVKYYDVGNVHDDISLVKHLIARKMIIVDMNQPINFTSLCGFYKKELEQWKKLQSINLISYVPEMNDIESYISKTT